MSEEPTVWTTALELYDRARAWVTERDEVMALFLAVTVPPLLALMVSLAFGTLLLLARLAELIGLVQLQ